MKKMSLAIFLILLVAFVFAGCLSFSGTIVTGTTEEEDDFPPYEDVLTTDVAGTYAPVGENTTDSSVLPGPGEITTSENSSGSDDVSESSSQNSTDEPSSSSGGASNVVVPASNEYNILKSGNFHMIGAMIDKTGVKTPLEIAVTSDSIYMLSDFEGTDIGMLIKNEKLYMVYPEKRAYLELSDTIMNMAGFDIDELINSENVNFSQFGDLTQAESVSEEVYEGHNCKVYHFKTESGESRVYMDGTKLIRLASYTSSGQFESSSEIVSISGNVPADKCSPPSGYKEYKGTMGAISFITLLGGAIS